jgi:hypothetical protein
MAGNKPKVKLPKVAKARNPFHDHPLLRKGGVHERTEKAKRKQAKQKFKKEWDCSITFFVSVIQQYHFYKKWLVLWHVKKHNYQLKILNVMS